MNTSKLMATGASFLAAAMLFAGCAGVTHEPKVDMAAQADIDDAAFKAALEKIGVDFEVVINIDATSDKENQYSYTKCVDEATAKALFDFYYADYEGLFDNKNFSGISSHEVGSNTAYILIDGRYDDQIAGTYTPYHDAIYLKGDTVIVAISSDYDLTIEKEVNDFLDALGYPHP